jgi:hypothetical protein
MQADQAEFTECYSDKERDMAPWLIGSLIGLGKGMLIDQPKERRQRELAAQTALYSPWTGMQPQPVQEASPFNSALQGGVMGMLADKYSAGGAGGSAAAAQETKANPTPPVTGAPGVANLGANAYRGPGSMMGMGEDFRFYNQPAAVSPYAPSGNMGMYPMQGLPMSFY